MLRRLDVKMPDYLEEQFLLLADDLALSCYSSPCILDDLNDEEKFTFSGETIVSFLVSTTENDATRIEADIRHCMEKEGLDPSSMKVIEYSEDNDWMEGFRQFFKTQHVTPDIIVKPPWERSANEEQAVSVIYIDPGMAFGTGTHETTRMCLKLLSEIKLDDLCFLDLGAGSGILSFYMMKRGAARGVAVEIEGAAVENMRKNMALNSLPDRLEIVCSKIEAFNPPFKADIIAANITTTVLLANMDLMQTWLKCKGRGIFSGINDSNSERLVETLRRDGWTIDSHLKEGDWHAFSASRP